MHIYRPWHEVLRKPADEVGSGEPAGGGETPPASDSTPPPAAAPEGPDLSWLPEQYRGESGPDIEGFRTHYEDMAASLAALSENQPEIPETPDAYDLSAPEEIDFGDIQPPEWFNFEIDQDSPILGELRNWMHEMKMPAEASKGLMGMLAKYEADRAAKFDQAANQEMQALGPQYEARLSRLQRTLETKVGNETQRNALLHSLTTADAVRGLEALVSGGSAVKPTSGPAAGVDIENMTPFQRLQIANSQQAGG